MLIYEDNNRFFRFSRSEILPQVLAAKKDPHFFIDFFKKNI